MSHLPPSLPYHNSASAKESAKVESRVEYVANAIPESGASMDIILDDDSLLNVFFLYRPFKFLVGEDEDDATEARIFGGKGGWVHEQWWYKLAHVCQRWRNLLLGSASYLGLCLVCTYGTPVADMLTHSPSLPLVIDYFDKNREITVEDEEGLVLALQECDRIRRVRLRMPLASLQKVLIAIEEEYPILEFLFMAPSSGNGTTLKLTETFGAPHLRHLVLMGFTIPTESRLLTTAVDLVVLCLFIDCPSTYFQPNSLLRWISFMPQLKTLRIALPPVPNRDVVRQAMRTPITTPIILPNIRSFVFRGVSAYIEALIHRITTPNLETLDIELFNQLTFSIPRLLQFVLRTENLRFDSAKFQFFRGRVEVKVYLREEAKTYALSIRVDCWPLDWQISSVAQISSGHNQVFSAVKYLTLDHEEHSRSFREYNEVDLTNWRQLFRSFSNVKSLRVEDGLVEGVSRCLQLDDGEHPLELLPELQNVTYSVKNNAGHTFTPFIDARKSAGHHVTQVRLNRFVPEINRENYRFLLHNMLQEHPAGDLTHNLDWIMVQEGPGYNLTHIAAANSDLHVVRGVDYGVGRGGSKRAAKEAAAREVYEQFTTKGIPGTPIKQRSHARVCMTGRTHYTPELHWTDRLAGNLDGGWAIHVGSTHAAHVYLGAQPNETSGATVSPHGNCSAVTKDARARAKRQSNSEDKGRGAQQGKKPWSGVEECVGKAKGPQ
ncbi:hypothetical protein F5888DRAFT_1631905 [Russula emetica]|nr:hypothetical protein F5888DRAFT_1631905 [Russula emetica]